MQPLKVKLCRFVVFAFKYLVSVLICFHTTALEYERLIRTVGYHWNSYHMTSSTTCSLRCCCSSFIDKCCTIKRWWVRERMRGGEKGRIQVALTTHTLFPYTWVDKTNRFVIRMPELCIHMQAVPWIYALCKHAKKTPIQCFVLLTQAVSQTTDAAVSK